jgi:hypothetical protein
MITQMIHQYIHTICNRTSLSQYKNDGLNLLKPPWFLYSYRYISTGIDNIKVYWVIHTVCLMLPFIINASTYIWLSVSKLGSWDLYIDNLKIHTYYIQHTILSFLSGIQFIIKGLAVENAPIILCVGDPGTEVL